MKKSLSQTIDISRWLAALIVVVGHCRQWTMVEFGDVTSKSAIWKVWYLVTGASHEAVIVFFVISGYLVGGLTIVRVRDRGFNQKVFWIHRFSRIYVVLIPALIVGFLLDTLGSHLFSPIYSATSGFVPKALSSVPSDNLSIVTLIGNMLMLQTILVNILGSNGPLWSLANEWWYYFIFSAGLGVFLYKRVYRIVSMAGLCAALLFLPFEIVLWMGFWLLGLALAVAVPRMSINIPALLGVAVFLVCLMISRVFRSYFGEGVGARFSMDMIVAVGYCVLLLSANKSIGETGGFLKGVADHTNEKLANFSYTLYLVHYPILIFVFGIFHFFGINYISQPSPFSAILTIILCLFFVAYAYCFSLLTERHTPAVRKFLERQIHTRSRRKVIDLE